MNAERLSSPRTNITRRSFLGTATLTAAALDATLLSNWPSLAAIGNTSDSAQAQARLWYDKPAANWNEALPLGNGRLGAMVFGGTTRERLQLNEETIWTGEPDKEEYYHCDGPKALPEIRRLTFEDKWSEA